MIFFIICVKQLTKLFDKVSYLINQKNCRRVLFVSKDFQFGSLKPLLATFFFKPANPKEQQSIS